MFALANFLLDELPVCFLVSQSLHELNGLDKHVSRLASFDYVSEVLIEFIKMLS